MGVVWNRSENIRAGETSIAHLIDDDSSPGNEFVHAGSEAGDSLPGTGAGSNADRPRSKISLAVGDGRCGARR